MFVKYSMFYKGIEKSFRKIKITKYTSDINSHQHKYVRFTLM